MDPITTLPNPRLDPGTPFADAFLRRGLLTFREACQWVKELPYGSNSRIDDAMVLFEEGCGTCFTKHGAIVRLAGELGLDIHKNVGFYRLTDEIITGVGDVLRPHGLDFVPTVHCFLEYGRHRVDLTEGNDTGKNKDLDEFDFVVRVGPESRDELQQHAAACFEHYASIAPQLAVLGQPAVGELVRLCHQQASATRCRV